MYLTQLQVFLFLIVLFLLNIHWVTGDERIYSLAQSSIRDNLRNDEKFIFLEFVYDDQLPILLNCPPDYISWLDLPVKYDKVKALKINLRKSAKLSY